MRFVVLVLVLLVQTAHADDDLAKARTLEASLEYDQALAIVDGLLAKGGNDPDRFVELHLFAGRLAGGLDKPDVAREHFARVLALRPDTTLPEGTSPKIAIPFAAVKAHAVPLAVTVTLRARVVRIETRDPLHLITGIAVHGVRGVASSLGERALFDVVERGGFSVTIPSDGEALEVVALDVAGNRLWIDREQIAKFQERPLPPPRHRPIYARWQTYAIASGVALASGGVAAWRFQVAQGDWNVLHDEGGHDFSELKTVEDRGRRWGTIANVSFGVAVGASIAAFVALYVDAFGTGDKVAITPASNGVAISGRF